jgi:hypothetical protein
MLSESEILERLANFMVVELQDYTSENDADYTKRVISASIFLDIVSGLRFHVNKQNAAQKLNMINSAIKQYNNMIKMRQEQIIELDQNQVLVQSTPQVIIDSTFREDIKK